MISMLNILLPIIIVLVVAITATASVAAIEGDSKYLLRINGIMAIFEVIYGNRRFDAKK